MKDNNVIQFPVTTDLDAQFLKLEKQSAAIEEQRKRIQELENKKEK